MTGHSSGSYWASSPRLADAKRRFSELIRAASSDGPQVATRQGKATTVVVDIAEHQRLMGTTIGFKEQLRAGPPFDDLELDRSGELPRSTDWAAGG